jgi:hypothetical protein
MRTAPVPPPGTPAAARPEPYDGPVDVSGPVDEEFTEARAAQVLAAALDGPGAESVLGSFAGVPGALYVPAKGGGFLRRAEPARLDVGQWRFVAGERLQVSHIVRDVVLRTSVVAPAEAARLLAEAVLAAARTGGPNAVGSLQGVLYGMAVVHGLA